MQVLHLCKLEFARFHQRRAISDVASSWLARNEEKVCVLITNKHGRRFPPVAWRFGWMLRSFWKQPPTLFWQHVQRCLVSISAGNNEAQSWPLMSARYQLDEASKTALCTLCVCVCDQHKVGDDDVMTWMCWWDEASRLTNRIFEQLLIFVLKQQ